MKYTIKPKSRKEIYLAYLGGQKDLELPEPLTRDEINLYNICMNPSGGVTSWNDLTDKPFGRMEAYLLPETELTFEMNEDLGVQLAMFFPAYEFENGATYTIKFDGKEYRCLYVLDEEGGDGYMGNMAAIGGEDTGEPFLVIAMAGEYILTGTSVSSALVSIKGMVNVRIPNKYAAAVPMLDLVELGIPTINDWETAMGDFAAEAVDSLKDACDGNGVIKIKASVQFAVNMSFYEPAMQPNYIYNNEKVLVFPAFAHRSGGEYVVSAMLEQGNTFFFVAGVGEGGQYNAIIRRPSFATVSKP